MGKAVQLLEAELASTTRKHRISEHSVAVLRREKVRLEGEALRYCQGKNEALEELARVKKELAVAEIEAAKAAKLEMELASAIKENEKLKAELHAVKQNEDHQLILNERAFCLKAIGRGELGSYYQERVAMCEMYLTEHGVKFPGQSDGCSEEYVDGAGTT